MATFRILKRLGLGLVCAGALPLSLGCQTTRKLTDEVHETLFPPQPATSMGCMWKKQVAYLPDPTKDGVLSPGIVGVMNLYAADSLPTKARGDLQFMGYDETPRSAGQVAAARFMWHFDPKVVKENLATKDDRGMYCSALFLPWPEHWTDVTKVRIQVKYIPKDGGTAITAADEVIAFETTPQITAGGVTGSSLAKTGPTSMRGIPDLKKILNQQQHQPLISKEKGDVVTAGAVIQPVTQPIIIPAGGLVPATPQAPTAPLQLPANAPLVIPQEAAPIPMPTPPPPPAMPAQVGATPMLPVIPGKVAEQKADTVIVPVGEGLPALEIPAAR